MEDILSLFPVKNHSFYGKHKTEYSKRITAPPLYVDIRGKVKGIELQHDETNNLVGMLKMMNATTLKRDRSPTPKE